jgi:hypothetical protein
MSKIDRRTFALGLLVMPLSGCPDPNAATTLATEQTQAYPPPIFRNYGYWHDSSVYVATGSLKP